MAGFPGLNKPGCRKVRTISRAPGDPRAVLALCVFCLLTAPVRAGDEPPALPDEWLAGAAPYPDAGPGPGGKPDVFDSLRTVAMFESYLLATWTPPRVDTNASVTLVVSYDEPGHWAVRDWRELPMHVNGAAWAARPPVDSTGVPVVYYVRAAAGGVTNRSGMRVCRPDLAGLAGASRPFDPFLEGFEQGTAAWSLVTDKPERTPPETDDLARSGYKSLRVRIASGLHSATVTTTRLRGWHITRMGATGIELWLRSRGGEGRAQFTLHTDAFTPAQTAVTSTVEAAVTGEWRKVRVPFASFAGLSPSRVDWFAIEFIGVGPVDFLVDDLQLVGPWKNIDL